MAGIVVIKAGSTFPGLVARQGDFEDWVLAGLRVPSGQAAVVDARDGSPLPEYGGLAGIVVTGSHDSVTDHLDWGERLAVWLRGAVTEEIPLLGICYGHQLLAYALGGRVDDNPHGFEFGSLEVQLTRAAHDDRLFVGLPDPLQVQLCHSQSVVRLPAGARRLASSTREPNQAYVVGGSAWGVQFHPEFNAAATMEYIHQFRDSLLDQKQDPDLLIDACVDTPPSHSLLRRFARIVRGRS